MDLLFERSPDSCRYGNKCFHAKEFLPPAHSHSVEKRAMLQEARLRVRDGLPNSEGRTECEQ